MKKILLISAVIILVVSLTITCFATTPKTYIIDGITKETLKTNNPTADIKLIEPHNEVWNKYTDYSYGYSILFPSDMKVDTSLSKIRTLFYNAGTQIEIYYDNFSSSQTNTNDYTYYSNRHIALNHTIDNDSFTELNGNKLHLLTWSRPKIAALTPDKNYYVCADIIVNTDEVYTIFIKSEKPIDYATDIISSFRTVSKHGTAKNYKYFYPSKTIMNDETKAFYNKYFGENAILHWGIFEPDAPENLEKLTCLEQQLDYSFPFLIRYQSLDENFPLRGIANAYNSNKYVELTLQTTHIKDVDALKASGRANASLMYDILSGKYDDYLNNYAQAIKAFGHPILFRLNNEMNGDWCWYSAYYTGKDTDIYKAVWRYIHNIFDHNGVNNVLWVFNPHDVSRPDFKWNHYLMYYPGDEYVDIIGLTGYNTGTYFPGETWREFDEIYSEMYAEYLETFDKPFMITEFSASSVGGNKANWIKNMFRHIDSMNNIKVAIWWSGIDYDGNDNPGRIYIIDENQEILDIFRKHLQMK